MTGENSTTEPPVFVVIDRRWIGTFLLGVSLDFNAVLHFLDSGIH